MNKRHNKWGTCLMCHQLTFDQTHRCPEEALAKKDAELDMVIDAELSTWSSDLKKFWNSNDVKFYEWVAENERNE